MRKLKQLAPETPVDLGERERKAPDLFGEFASTDELSNLDDRIENDVNLLYPWCPSVAQGGERRSLRIQLIEAKKKQFEKGKETMKLNPLHQLIRARKQPATQPATQPAKQPTTLATAQAATQPATPFTPANTAGTPPPSPSPQTATIDSLLSQQSKRRLIQIAFELLGSPAEFNDQGEDQWHGRDGVINNIIKYFDFRSHRIKEQILNVIRYVMRCTGQGETDIDAGIKINACNSGRSPLLRDVDNRRVAKCLREGFGLQMTRSIVNRGREISPEVSNEYAKVSISTIRRSAKTAFSGVCKNRRTKKTGNKDPSSIWCLARHEFALQLQQQFRQGDAPGQQMVGITVCKFWQNKLYIGKITSYDRSRKWYKVLYEDGDEEELTSRELRIKVWKKIPRPAVLWLDEKVCLTLTVTLTLTLTLTLTVNSTRK